MIKEHKELYKSESHAKKMLLIKHSKLIVVEKNITKHDKIKKFNLH